MEFKSKMDDLTLVLFILSILVFPIFILFLIHVLMIKYVVGNEEVKVVGLFKNLNIKYEDIISAKLKTYSSSIISSDASQFLTALGNKGIEIEYKFDNRVESVFVSPNNPDKMLAEILKHLSDDLKGANEVVVPEIV